MGNGWALKREILNGYRMTPPEYSPNFFGKIMENCWKAERKERPTFSKLAEMMENHIKSNNSLDYLN